MLLSKKNSAMLDLCVDFDPEGGELGWVGN